MTLVASGTISIGGTVANASIEQEIGASGGFSGSFNQMASLNDASLRSLAGITGAGTTISMASFYGKSSLALNTQTLDVGNQTPTSTLIIALDSYGQAYRVYESSTLGTINIAKNSPTGVLQWQKAIYCSYANISNQYLQVLQVVVHPNDSNVYVLVKTPGVVIGTTIYKISSAGAITWAYTLINPGGGGANVTPVAFDVDSSSNIHLIELTGYPYHYVLSKYSDSMTLSYSRYSYDGLVQPQLVKADSSGNAHFVGITNIATWNAGGAYHAAGYDYTRYWGVTKLNSAGATLWQTGFNAGVHSSGGLHSYLIFDSAGYTQPTSFDIDSSGNVYVPAAMGTGVGLPSSGIVKYNSSGTLQWAKSGLGSGYNPFGVLSNPAGSLVCTGDTSGYGIVTLNGSTGAFSSRVRFSLKYSTFSAAAVQTPKLTRNATNIAFVYSYNQYSGGGPYTSGTLVSQRYGYSRTTWSQGNVSYVTPDSITVTYTNDTMAPTTPTYTTGTTIQLDSDFTSGLTSVNITGNVSSTNSSFMGTTETTHLF